MSDAETDATSACTLCKQSFETEDRAALERCCFIGLRSPLSGLRNAPEGHSSVVQRVKEKSSVCSPCFYCLRGSFPSTKINELRDAMDQHQNISEKLLLSTMFEV